MKITLEVGDQPRHQLEFSFNQLLGRTLLKIDGHEVFRKKRWFSEPVVDAYEFQIAVDHPVNLRIEKERRHLFRSKYRIYLNNRLTQFCQGI